ncbi:NAD-dependent epimerase/dehydratase family protein [Dyella halodurans]|uniref:NAD-dependent epimerase/dehydratase family protein n=1 Tax=Dyella halodurans TaxID=1920171 RepID=A0ABV9BX24_9GAMM|nr:NAD-dependent epimerase/dehydratase family protein [Dyella halodurans]
MSRGRILLTGASGFTGHYAAEALRRAGYDVHEWRSASGLGTAESVDLLDRTAVAAAVGRAMPDYVLHLAAISFIAHGNAAAIYAVNIVGTRNLLEALSNMETPPRHVLLASSANVYGEQEGGIDESAPLRPQNDYAVSKMAMERMASLWMGRLPITIVRPFNYTGVGQDVKFLLPKIVSHFQRRAEVMELGNIDVWRDFSDVRRVVESYVRLLDRPGKGEVFNVCSGKERSIREIIATMEQISGHRIEVRVNPAFVRDNEITHLHGDPGRLERAVGPLPQFEIRDTLAWMYLAQA